MNNALTTIVYPEMQPASQDTIQVEFSGITGRYIVRSQSEIKKARGITFDAIISPIGANNMPNKRAGWYRYYMTKAAFDNFSKSNCLTLNILLD